MARATGRIKTRLVTDKATAKAMVNKEMGLAMKPGKAKEMRLAKAMETGPGIVTRQAKGMQMARAKEMETGQAMERNKGMEQAMERNKGTEQAMERSKVMGMETEMVKIMRTEMVKGMVLDKATDKGMETERAIMTKTRLREMAQTAERITRRAGMVGKRCG